MLLYLEFCFLTVYVYIFTELLHIIHVFQAFQSIKPRLRLAGLRLMTLISEQVVGMIHRK